MFQFFNQFPADTVQEKKLAGVRFKNLLKISNRRRYIQSKEGIQNTSNTSLGLSIPPAVLRYFLKLLETNPRVNEQENPSQPDYKEDDLVANKFGARKSTKERTFPASDDTIPEAAQVGESQTTERSVEGGSETKSADLKETDSS
ncbi:hypothetical protein V6N11_054001 [Hibiscus sabdariffa]|uniref:Uncharacterized protein n=1 Tax=Hibiscus sabdariffa TaxID=183260 RepID=A0ABR2S2M1_9ROSI